MYNVLQYSDNYSMTSESLRNYHGDYVNNVNDNASDGKSIKFKTKITRETEVRSMQGGNDGDAN